MILMIALCEDLVIQKPPSSRGEVDPAARMFLFVFPNNVLESVVVWTQGCVCNVPHVHLERKCSDDMVGAAGFEAQNQVGRH